MIVVDSGVWADWLKGKDAPAVDRLYDGIVAANVTATPLIVTEVLQGLRSDDDFDRAEALLSGLPLLTLDTAGHVAAARLFHSLRRRGITIRGTIDCLIAQTCVDADAELLTTDRDFVRIAEHSALQLCDF